MRTATIVSLVMALATSGPALAEFKSLPMPFAQSKESRQVSVVVDRGLTRTKSLPTAALQQARVDMLEGKDIGPDLLRQLAERKDGLAALRYVRLLAEQGIAENASDIAYFGAIAVGAGRVWVLPEMVAAMHHLSPETEPKNRINKYIQVLYPHAWAGNTLALDAVIAFNGEGKLFGPLSNATRTRIEEQLNSLPDGQGDLKLAINILRKGTISSEERNTALVHLRRAAQANHLAVATTAANLIEQLTAETQTHAAVTN